jgi:hypothetical protein
LSTDNAKLQRDLDRARKGAPKTLARAVVPQRSVYRMARRAVGRPLRKALQSGRQ